MGVVENAEGSWVDLGARHSHGHAGGQLRLAQATLGDEIGICEGVGDGSASNPLVRSIAAKLVGGLLTVGHVSLEQRVAPLGQMARACWIHGNNV